MGMGMGVRDVSLSERGVCDCDGGDGTRKLWRGLRGREYHREREHTSEPMMAVYEKGDS